jgi:hypothetical protein
MKTPSQAVFVTSLAVFDFYEEIINKVGLRKVNF